MIRRDPPFPMTVEDPLTDHQLADCARKMAALMREKEGVETERKANQDEFKSRISSKETEIANLGRRVSEGTEQKEVEVCWRMNFEANQKELFRIDTEQIIEVAEISEEERQEEFGFDGGKHILEGLEQDIKQDPPQPPPPAPPPADEPEQPGRGTPWWEDWFSYCLEAVPNFLCCQH